MTKLLSIATRADAPITCDLSSATDSLADRLAEYWQLFELALVGRESMPTATTFRFAAHAGIADRVCDPATREAACCGFLSYDIDLVGDEVVWTVSIGLGASELALVDEVLRATEELGSAQIARRLEEHGVPVIDAPVADVPVADARD